MIWDIRFKVTVTRLVMVTKNIIASRVNIAYDLEMNNLD